MHDSCIKASKSPEVLTGERCHIREQLNDARVPAVSVARTRVEPGVTTELHRLAVDEYYLIAAGEGLMRVGEQAPFPIGPGDSVMIPAGTAQQISNTGREDLVFQCVCLPRFTPECYESLE
ncbi:MAG: cupin domain-containing protein [Woeseia sp.]